MSELYQRVLLWHKLVAQTTGGLALCSAKKVLPRGEATLWIAALQNVADEMREVLAGRPFILDAKGQRVSDGGAKTEARVQYFDKEGAHVEQTTQSNPKTPGTGRKTGALRIARRKT